MVIDVPKICGEDLISRDAGQKIRRLILSSWNEPLIELKFNGRLVGSVSFFDEAIGLLMKKEGKSLDEIKKKLHFPDLLKEDQMLLNYTMNARIKELPFIAKHK